MILSHNRRDAIGVRRVPRQHRHGRGNADRPEPGQHHELAHRPRRQAARGGDLRRRQHVAALPRNRGREFKPIAHDELQGGGAPLFFTFDNQRSTSPSNRGRDKAAIFEFDPATAKEGALLVESPEVDVDGAPLFAQAQGAHRRALDHVEDCSASSSMRETEAMFRDIEAQASGLRGELHVGEQGRGQVHRRRDERPHAAASATCTTARRAS